MTCASKEKSTEPPEQDGLPKRERMLVLGIMVTGTTAACISQSMMTAALPTIMHEFSVGATFGQLLTTGYIFTLGLISAMTAYLVNHVGSKKLFLVSMLCFTVGCAAALVAPNYPLLLASRLLQAGGAGIALPLIQVVALSVYPKSEYGKAMGLVGLIVGFAPAIGPTVSGFLIDLWGWHSVFAVLGAVGLAVIVASLALLKDMVHAGNDHARFDALSGILYAVGFYSILVGVTELESGVALSAISRIALAVGVVIIAVFVRRQLHVEHPLLKLSCFRDRTFTVSTILVMVGQMGMMTGAVMVPLFVQDVQMQSATVSGLTILPGAILMGFLNPITGRLLDRYGPHPLIATGCAVLAAGTLAFALCDSSTPAWVVTVLYGVRTVGVSCLMMPMTGHACTVLDASDIAQGTAIITSFRQLFSSLSTSIFIAIMAHASSNAIGVDAFGFGVSFTVLAALVAAAFVFGMVCMPKRRSKTAN